MEKRSYRPSSVYWRQRNLGTTKRLNFMSRVDLTPLAEIFRAKVLSMLKKEGKIDDDFTPRKGVQVRMLMGWRHNSGFSMDNGVRISRDDEDGKEALAQYILRNPFSVEKLTYNEETGTVIYNSKLVLNLIQ